MIGVMMKDHIKYQLDTVEEVSWVDGDFLYYAFINSDNLIEYNIYDNTEMEPIDGGVHNRLEELLEEL